MAAKVGARWGGSKLNGLQKAWQKRCGEVGLFISGRKAVTFTETTSIVPAAIFFFSLSCSLDFISLVSHPSEQDAVVCDS